MSETQDDIDTLTDGKFNARDVAAIKRIASKGNVKLWAALALTALISVAPQILDLLHTDTESTKNNGIPEH